MNTDTLSNRHVIGGALIIGLALFAITGITTSGTTSTANSIIQNVDATVYKSPNCGCCGAWAQYARSQGMNVEVKEVNNLDQIKDEHNVPEELSSCHTTVLDDYVVEGHVPVESIARLLENEPDVSGIGLPGMPQGSPGMPGPKQGDWQISSFTESGNIEAFMTV
ncbi:MAG: DUF411 domain-containing protein [Candidatus Nanohaloarchaeota archaeon QJJ-5]|nr:DUF411 domain-containing protein [Candidatus Nanohaloarchaeota archaeon QJJ-5]